MRLFVPVVSVVVLCGCGCGRVDYTPTDGGFDGSAPADGGMPPGDAGPVSSPGDCFDAGCWFNPQPHGQSGAAMWASAPDDVWQIVYDYGAGTSSAIDHWDGSRWTRTPIDVSTNLAAISGTSPSDIWAAGLVSHLAHYNGVGWSAVPTPLGNWTSIWAASPTDVWVMGSSGAVAHSAGASFTSASIPTTATIHALWGAATNDIWAVGDTDTFLHYDGSTWTAVPPPVTSTNPWVSVWGSSGNDVWVVGQGASHVYRWNGSAWTSPSAPSGEYDKVTGTGPNDVWLLGVDGSAHFDGTSWSTQTSSTPLLHGVAVAPNDVRATNGSGAHVHWDGTAWRTTGLLTGRTIVDSWGASASDVWAVGAQGLVLRWDGTAWRVAPKPIDADIETVYGDGTGSVWVGGSFGVLRWDGTTWTPEAFPLDEAAYAIDSAPGTSLYAVTDHLLLRRTGTMWTQVTALPHAGFRCLAVVSDSEMWVGGPYGYAERWNGSGLDELTLPAGETGHDLMAVGGQVFLSLSLDVLTFDGTMFTPLHSVDVNRPYGFSGTSATNVWVAAAGGAVIWNGVRWIPRNPPNADFQFRSVWAAPDGSYAWVFGTDGAIYRATP